MNGREKLVFRILQLATCSVFAGRSWQYLYWDAPYRTLLWDESLMRKPVALFLSMEWSAYVTDPGVEAGIQLSVTISGLILLLCAVGVWLLNAYPRFIRPLLYVGSGLLLLLAFLYFKEKFYQPAQFIELSAQWASPLLLLWLHRTGEANRSFRLALKIVIALTFTGHGLYAIGVHPRPGHFMQMIMNILALDSRQSILLLNTAGVLDFLISILIFLPPLWARPALLYAVFWGGATTLARIWAHFHPDFWENSLLRWVHESVFRIPHFTLPIVALLLLPPRAKNDKD